MATDEQPDHPRQSAVIALDLGGTKLNACLYTADSRQSHRCTSTLDGRQGAAVGALIVRELLRLRSAAADRSWTLKGVGICVPGIAAKRTGRVWAPNIPGWEDYPLRDEIVAAIADPAVGVAVADDRAAYILGEAWQGAARGCRDAIFLAVGTGIGAGILVDGRVLSGAHGVAGAIGWMALDRPFKPEYAAAGCFESRASGAGLASQYTAALAASAADDQPQTSVGAATTQDLFDASAAGDAIAERVLSQAVELWGMAVANLISLFNPEKIIFGGGVFGPAVQFLPAIVDEARRWAQPVSMARASFEASQLGGDAGLCGAGHLALFGTYLQTRPITKRSPHE